MQDIIENFREWASELGYPLPQNINANTAKIQRCEHPKKGSGNKDLGYKVFTDGTPNGLIWDYLISGTEPTHKWTHNIPRKAYTPEQRKQHAIDAEAKRQKDELAEAAKRAESAKLVNDIASHCIATMAHEYTDSKHVLLHNALLNTKRWKNPWYNKNDESEKYPYLAWPCPGDLVVRFYNENSTLVTIQSITPNGEKRFLKNGQVKGCFHQFGSYTETILIAEGWATAASLYESTGLLTVAAGSSCNLSEVAAIFRKKYPTTQIILCGDNDSNKNGVGEKAAIQAALSIGGMHLIPETPGHDWNDCLTSGGSIDLTNAVDTAKNTPNNEREPLPDSKNNPPIPPTIISATTLQTMNDNACSVADNKSHALHYDLSATTLQDAHEQEGAKPNDNDTIRRLAALSPLDYDRERKKASDILGVRPATLDKLVAAERKGADSSNLGVDDVDLWPEPINPAQLLDEIRGCVHRFIVCEPETAIATTLWLAMTWFIDVVNVAPIASITAPEKRCGKTQLLSLIGKLSARPLAASSISPAAIYRVIEAWKPTLILDEADAFMRDNEELRGIINSGHTRDTAYVVRVQGDDHAPVKFSTWGAKAIAGIGYQAITIMDRSIILELRRKLPSEHVERLRYAEPDLFDVLASKLARFSDDHRADIRKARPNLPRELNDRAQDNWEPLLAIADISGDHWPHTARNAALKLSGIETATKSKGAQLLSDIKDVFDNNPHVDKIFTANLLEHLCSDDELNWSTYNRGQPINPRQLVSLLDDYKIKSKDVRISQKVKKGYERIQFEESFNRYLSCETLPETLQATSGVGCSVVADKYQCSGSENNPLQLQATSGGGCSVVADKIPYLDNENGMVF